LILQRTTIAAPEDRNVSNRAGAIASEDTAMALVDLMNPSEWIGDFFMSVMRKVAGVLAGLVIYAVLSVFGFGVTRAEAACDHIEYFDYLCDTRAEAYAQADLLKDAYGAYICNGQWGSPAVIRVGVQLYNNAIYDYGVECASFNGEMIWSRGSSGTEWRTEGCPIGTGWNEAAHACVIPTPFDPAKSNDCNA
jgi:hypothetical protein